MTKGWGEVGDGASFLEALHRADLEHAAWFDGIWRALSSLVPGSMTIMCGLARWQPGHGGIEMELVRGPHAEYGARARETSHHASGRFVSATLASPRRVTMLSEVRDEGISEPVLDGLLGEFGVADFLTLKSEVSDGSQRLGAVVSALSASTIRLSRRARATFEGYAAHLGAAFRLRQSGLAARVEGVLSPSGRMLHAEGELRDREAQEALRRAVLAIERARRKERRTDQVALLEAWRAIYERRWTVVEAIESDGRRILLARVNPPTRHVDAKMTPREREVAALVAQGVPQKTVGYELALSPSTVAFHVRNIAKKLGAASSTDLVRVLALAGQRGA